MEGIGYWIFLIILYGLSTYIRRRQKQKARESLEREEQSRGEEDQPQQQDWRRSEIFKELFGGTGKTFDKNLVKAFKGKLIIAGGLNPENVLDVFSALHPFCVDVCSGVESDPGKKDDKKMIEIINKVREYEIKH